jgi:hypothetical protein
MGSGGKSYGNSGADSRTLSANSRSQWYGHSSNDSIETPVPEYRTHLRQGPASRPPGHEGNYLRGSQPLAQIDAESEVEPMEYEELHMRAPVRVKQVTSGLPVNMFQSDSSLSAISV